VEERAAARTDDQGEHFMGRLRLSEDFLVAVQTIAALGVIPVGVLF
jgi:hypothetical protein